MTFADGFNAVGAVDTSVTVGAGVTYQIPAGNEGKKLYVYMNSDGTLGSTQVPFAKGVSRQAADTWGVQSGEFRTTAVHSEAHSATGVVSASSENATTIPPWLAFDGNQSLNSWICKSTTTTTGNVLDTDEWVQYIPSQARVLEAWRIAVPATVNRFPDKLIVQGTLNGGASWVDVDASYETTSIPVTLAQGLFTDWFEVSTTVAYDAYRWFFLETSGSTTQVSVSGIEIRTSAPKGDFYNVTEGITYDSTDTPIKRVYLAEVDVNTEGEASSIKNYGVAQSHLMDTTVHGLLETTENVKIVDFGVVTINKRYVIKNPFGNAKWEGCDVKA